MFEPTMIIAAASLTGLVIVAAAMLRGWQGWLDLKRRELEEHSGPRQEEGSSMGAARIELADLKERIKKLEAIASGVDL
ncbi:hypothetical protein K3163_03850 [Qipengyuania sp. 1NDW9]|uniref:Uncharacterized protein n=2 Tax=Qipengyuania TaxID=1855416 RepID=A0A9Q3S1S9_9SPHN|nr:MULTISPECIES: hypothetical protein [Qipengyuania]MBX7492336.1 hypothetical protein [Qipengyuania xiapuensis]MBY6127994.1 hypothetical protein [Qipengyuania aquimaris]MBY6218491.1 hypothetical protein [Qipengyuania aquimaris]QZD93438.1 hypothetical protein K3162_05320 [Qipengyuania xiapuensis]UOR15567.1 hypothetical protein LCM05_00560 [Qipengyuania aquimaris]